MLKIGDKTFLNIQEAVGWLMDNNPIPFQCTAPYAANTEIGLGTIVNPSPAKVRIGSIIFFSDSKVSTVTGITQNGFIVSDEYNDLVDDIVYIKNVAINASGHLMVTLSNGKQIDAGQIKQIESFSIDGASHLIAFYNDGTSQDLGAIFNGNVSIAGSLNVSGDISGQSIVERMVGYSYSMPSVIAEATTNITYASVVKNGNKVTMVITGEVTRTASVPDGNLILGSFNIPSSVGQKLIPVRLAWLSFVNVYFAEDYNAGKTLNALAIKDSNQTIRFSVYGINALDLNTKYYARLEVTFLLSDNMA